MKEKMTFNLKEQKNLLKIFNHVKNDRPPLPESALKDQQKFFKDLIRVYNDRHTRSIVNYSDSDGEIKMVILVILLNISIMRYRNFMKPLWLREMKIFDEEIKKVKRIQSLKNVDEIIFSSSTGKIRLTNKNLISKIIKELPDYYDANNSTIDFLNLGLKEGIVIVEDLPKKKRGAPIKNKQSFINECHLLIRALEEMGFPKIFFAEWFKMDLDTLKSNLVRVHK